VKEVLLKYTIQDTPPSLVGPKKTIGKVTTWLKNLLHIV